MLGIALVSALAGSALENFAFGLSLAVGLSWLFVAFATAPSAEQRWSPLRLYVPLFAVYNGCSLSLSETSTKPIEILCTALALAGFSLGAAVAGTARAPQGVSDEMTPRARPALVLALFLAACLVFGALVIRAGGVPILAADSNLARTEFFPSGVHSTIVVVGFQVSVMAVGCGIAMGSRWARTPLMIAVAVGASVALGVLANRGMLALPILVVVIAIFWVRRVNIAVALAVAVTAITLFSYAGYHRNLQAWGYTYINDLSLLGYGASTALFAPVLSYLAGTSETFSRTILLVPDHIPFQGGLQFFGPLLLQPSADLFIKDAAGLDFVGFGLAIGFTNAFYLDWGVIGCFLGPLVFGLGVGLVYRKADQSRAAGRGLLAYTTASMLLTLYGHPFAYLSYLAIPVLLYLCLGGFQSRSAKPLPKQDVMLRRQ